MSNKYGAKRLTAMSAAKKRNKYNATTVKTKDGLTFSSKREYSRWLELVLLERSGEITGLERQVTYRIDINGMHICKYIADFTYIDDGKSVVEDSKGAITPVYKLKKKLMLALHGIEIFET